MATEAEDLQRLADLRRLKELRSKKLSSNVSTTPEAPSMSLTDRLKAAPGDLARGAAGLAAFGGDIAMAPFKGAYHLATGDKPDYFAMSGQMEKDLSSLGMPRRDGDIQQRVLEGLGSPLTKSKLLLQSIQGMLGGLGLGIGENIAPDSAAVQMGLGLLGGASPAVASRTMGKSAAQTASSVADKLRTVTPDALTEAVGLEGRTGRVLSGISDAADDAKTSADTLYTSLGDAPVELKGVSTELDQMIKDRAGHIDPNNPVGPYATKVANYATPEKIDIIPASNKLDANGNPIPGTFTPQSSVVTPATHTAPFEELRQTVKDIRAAKKNAVGNDFRLLEEAETKLLAAMKQSLPSNLFKAYEEADAAWAAMKSAYSDGATGKALESLKDPAGRLKTFRQLLLGDPKATEQLTSIMTPSQLRDSQNLVLTDLLTATPGTWATKITKNYDSYSHLFGAKGVERLLSMVSTDGSIGKLLLSDATRLNSIITGPLMKTMVGAGAGAAAIGPWGVFLGALTGGRATAKAAKVHVARGLIARAAAGSPEALAILNSPAAKVSNSDVAKAIYEGTRARPKEEEATPARQSQASINSMAQQVFQPPPMEPKLLPRSPELVLTDPQMSRALMSQLSPDGQSILNDAVSRKDPLAMEAAMTIAMSELPHMFEPSITGLASEMIRGNDIVLTNPTEGQMYGATISSMYHQGSLDANFLAEQTSYLNTPHHMKILPRPDHIMSLPPVQNQTVQSPVSQMASRLR